MNNNNLKFATAFKPGVGTVTVHLYFHAGASVDPKGKEGLAYVYSRALQRGTSNMDRKAYLNALDSMGASLDIKISKDYLVIRGEVLSKNISCFMDLLKEVMKNPSFSEEEIKKVKREIAAEHIYLREDDSSLVMLNMWNAFYGDSHPYGHPSGGTPTGVSSIAKDDIIDFHSKILSSKPLLGAAGDINEDKFNAEILSPLEKLFSKQEHSKAHIPAVDNMKEDVKILLLEKPDRTQVQLVLAVPATPAWHPHYYELHTAVTCFGGTFRSRLSQEIRDKRGLTYHISSRIPDLKGNAPMYIRTFMETDKIDKGVPIVLDLLDNFLENGVTDDELKHGVNYLKNSFPFLRDIPEKATAVQLSNTLLSRPETFFEDFEKFLQTASADAVSNGVKSALKKTKKRILVMAGDKTLLKTAEKWFPNRSIKTEVRGYLDDIQATHNN